MMFVVANFLEGLAVALRVLLIVSMWFIIIRAVISWVNPNPYHPIVQFLYRSTEPVLAPIRRRLPWMGGVDLSPIVAFVIIVFLQVFLVGSLHDLAVRLR